MEKNSKKSNKHKKHKRTLHLIFKELKQYMEDHKENDKFRADRYNYAFNSDFKFIDKHIDKKIDKKYSNEMNDLF